MDIICWIWIFCALIWSWNIYMLFRIIWKVRQQRRLRVEQRQWFMTADSHLRHRPRTKDEIFYDYIPNWPPKDSPASPLPE